MTKLKLLDLFCCGGGAGMGYHQAGFDVTGVDIAPQPKYPFRFVQADALAYLAGNWQNYDAIHASPPCQEYSLTKQCQPGAKHPDLVGPVRELLLKTDLPWVIENVPGAPLLDPILLCGSMFGLRTYRHRLFESNIPLYAPVHPKHTAPNAKMGRAPKPGEFIQVVGHFSGVPFAKEAMGIDWLGRDALAQAIPPAYTKFIGEQLTDALALRLAA